MKKIRCYWSGELYKLYLGRKLIMQSIDWSAIQAKAKENGRELKTTDN